MKTKLTIIALLLILTSLFVSNIDARATATNDDPVKGSIEIIITTTASSSGHIKRTPAYINISAVYDNITECVVTTFAQNIGTVTITLTNETTGETSTTTVDSSFGTSSIQTSGTSGSWHVEYATSGGSTYEGNFTL